MPKDIPVGNGNLLLNFDLHYRIRDVYYPWVGQENIRPKSIAREMFENFRSFADYIRDYELQRSEGLLLRQDDSPRTAGAAIGEASAAVREQCRVECDDGHTGSEPARTLGTLALRCELFERRAMDSRSIAAKIPSSVPAAVAALGLILGSAATAECQLARR